MNVVITRFVNVIVAVIAIIKNVNVIVVDILLVNAIVVNMLNFKEFLLTEAFDETIMEVTPQNKSHLLIYADWLEEQGDSFGEYIRIAMILADDLYNPQFNELIHRGLELYIDNNHFRNHNLEFVEKLTFGILNLLRKIKLKTHIEIYDFYITDAFNASLNILSSIKNINYSGLTVESVIKSIESNMQIIKSEFSQLFPAFKQYILEKFKEEFEKLDTRVSREIMPTIKELNLIFHQ